MGKNKEPPAQETHMLVHQTLLTIHTCARGAIDVTGDVAEAVAVSGVHTGICQVFIRHTSASLMITENADPDVRHDLETLLGRFAPDGDPAYRHDAEGDDDMAAHGRALLTGAGMSVPVVEGRLGLGTWQGLYVYEHRTSAHRRELVVTVMGSPPETNQKR